MWHHIGTLRFKLTVLNLAVFGLLLVLLNATILIVRERDLREQFDTRLRDRAEVIVDEITLPIMERSNPAEVPTFPRRFNPFRFPGYFFQLRSAGGDVLERSRSLAEQTLPLEGAATAARDSDAPIVETIQDGVARTLLEGQEELRLLTLYRNEVDSPPFYLQMAVSTKPLERSIVRLRRIVWVVGPVALVIAAVASWFLAGRSLAPLVRVADVADQLQADQFALRFQTPPGRDEVANMVLKINAMLDRLSDSFLSQERFITDAAHELKTPLAVLLGEAQVLMQQERSPEEYTRFVTDVEDGARSLAQTVDSLLTLARAEAGIPAANVSAVPLNEMVVDAVEQCNTAAAQREVRLVPELVLAEGDEADPAILGDGALLRLMVGNLIRNAVRYSPPEEAVDIAVALEGTDAVISVRDRGPGIPPEFIDKVFDRFFRVADPKSSFKGAGLGLTIVRGVARLHGGSVQVRNHPEGGCEFTVRLPCADRAELTGALPTDHAK